MNKYILLIIKMKNYSPIKNSEKVDKKYSKIPYKKSLR